MNIFNVGNGSVNIYLLDSGTHRLLIETGFPGTLNDLGRRLRQTGHKLRDIDYLLVTHFHVDHAGMVQELKNAGAQFLLFDVQTHAIAPMEALAGKKWQYLPLVHAGNLVLPVHESRAFLKGLNIDGAVLHTPGHSADSISLLLDTGAAFTGDLPAEGLVQEEGPAKDVWALLREGGAARIKPGHGQDYDL